MVNDWLATLATRDGSVDANASGTNAITLDQLAGRADQVISLLSFADQKDSPEARSHRLETALELAVDLAKLYQQRRVAQTPLENPAWVRRLAKANDPLVSSLFEAFLPAHERQRRLGPMATFSDVADISGDATRGKAYFFDEARSQCSKCHKVHDTGGLVGPALSDIGKRQSAAQIFESIVDPSRIVEPKYQTHLVVTDEGQAIAGLLVSESATELKLVDAKGQQLTIAKDKIESRKLDTKSLMPTGLVGELTAQQAADLLAYLSTLK